MDFPIDIEKKYELASYNKDELAQIIGEMGTKLTYAIKMQNLRQEKMAVLRKLPKSAAAELVKAYSNASSQVEIRTPFTLSTTDMFKNDGILLLDVNKIVTTIDNESKSYPLKKGAVDWDGKLRPPLVDLATEVASDAILTATTVSKSTDIVSPMFKHLENTDQRTASESIVKGINEKGLIKMRQASSYALAGDVYQAMEKSHPHTTMAYINNVTKRDPKSIESKSKYQPIPGWNLAMIDPIDGTRKAYQFAVPPEYRAASGGAFHLNGVVSKQHLFALHQQFGAAIGESSAGRGGFHSAFQFNAPVPPVLSSVLNTLQNIRQLELLPEDLIVLNSGDGGLASMLSHNLKRSVAYMGPGMLNKEIKDAWEAGLPISYSDVRTLEIQVKKGEQFVNLRLVHYYYYPYNLAVGSDIDDNNTKCLKAFIAATTGIPKIVERGDIAVLFARPSAMGDNCLSNDQVITCHYDDSSVNYYVGMNINVSTCCVMFCTDKTLLRKPITCAQASILVALYMFNYSTWRWHKIPWFTTLEKVLEKPGVLTGLDFESFRAYQCSILPVSKVKSGFDLNYLSAAGEQQAMDYDVKYFEQLQANGGDPRASNPPAPNPPSDKPQEGPPGAATQAEADEFWGGDHSTNPANTSNVHV